MEGGITVGVDLGGTKIEVAVLRHHDAAPPEILLRRRTPTRRELGYQAVLDGVARAVREACEAAGLDAARTPVGVGMPGGVTRKEGLVKNSNTTCLNGRPFRADLERLLRRPLRFDNDANCFALAEARLGAAAPYREGVVFGAILGTGVGGGVVLRGEVWRGRSEIAGEWGHHAVFAASGAERDDTHLRACYCGRRGCLEAYASGPAVEDDYARRAGRRRSLAELAALRGDDPHAARALETLLVAVGRGLANVINILDPSAIVLGGGVSNLDLLYSDGVEQVARGVFNDELVTPILRHALGDSAGVIGAALLPLDEG